MSAFSGPPGAEHGPCPICGKPRAQRYRPFCSKRCADIDLGRWLGERYRIPGPSAPPPDNNDEA